MNLYRLIPKAWGKVVIALLQRVINLQTIMEALAYNCSRTESTLPTARPIPVTISALCGCNLVHIILRRRIKYTSTVTPTWNTPCDHAQCNMYAATHMKCDNIKGCFLFTMFVVSSTTRHNIPNTLSEHLPHTHAYVSYCPSGHSFRIDNLLLPQHPLY